MAIEDLVTKADLAAFIDERIGSQRQQIAQVRARIRYGSGSPEGVLAAKVGTFYVDEDGGAGVTAWVKESGAADDPFGWAAM